MGHPIRTLVWVSGLLAAASFGYVLVFSPIEEGDRRAVRDRRGSSTQPASAARLDQSFRRAFVQGRGLAAKNIADQMTSNYPQNPASWYNRGNILVESGDTQGAAHAWYELECVADQIPETEPGRRAYFRAWAAHGLGERDEAQKLFAQAADLYEQSLSGGGRVFGGQAYNLACYRAMAGQHELAMEHWERALGTGLVDEDLWWLADPDLDPIREDPRFMEIALRHGYVQGSSLGTEPSGGP